MVRVLYSSFEPSIAIQAYDVSSLFLLPVCWIIVWTTYSFSLSCVLLHHVVWQFGLIGFSIWCDPYSRLSLLWSIVLNGSASLLLPYFFCAVSSPPSTVGACIIRLMDLVLGIPCLLIVTEWYWTLMIRKVLLSQNFNLVCNLNVKTWAIISGVVTKSNLSRRTNWPRQKDCFSHIRRLRSYS